MYEHDIDQQKTRDALRRKRNLLVEDFFKDPSNTRLAIEIRLIDDRIADLTEHLVTQKTLK